MNNNTPYSNYSLCNEMLETPDVMTRFDLNRAWSWAEQVAAAFSTGAYDRILLTGEGSSRIFPAKGALYTNNAGKSGLSPKPLFTEGCTQALDYDLSRTLIIGASNSGKTKELIRLFQKLNKEGHAGLFGITAHKGTILGELATTFVLDCGSEAAVAATKSVVEQALAVHLVLHVLQGGSREDFAAELNRAAEAVGQALTARVEPGVIESLGKAPLVYFAGRNTGVAEELALKTNEITRKKSAYLEGTLAVHGIEEVMDPGEALILVEPFEDEEPMFQKHLVGGVGISVVAISSRQTSFPTLKIPSVGRFQNIVELAAGWNLLVETGLALSIDLDTPKRARKVGNEFVGS